MRVTLASVVAVAALIGAGLIHGSWTNRWRQSRELERAVAGLEGVPLKAGRWKGEEFDLDARMIERAGVDGWRGVRYTDPDTHNSLTVLLVCGRAGPVSVHTPDVCYGGAGYKMLGKPERHTFADGVEFRVVRFRKQGLGETRVLRVFWAWSTQGTRWEAPDVPRLSFGSAPALYKLYVVRELAAPDEPVDEDPAVDLLRRFVSEFAKKTVGSP